MRRTVAETLRAASLACAAVAVLLCLVNDRSDGARWDALAALVVGACCIGAWAALTRRTPPSGPPSPAPAPLPAPPAELLRNPVDWYLAAGMVLTAVAPWAVFRFAAHEQIEFSAVLLGGTLLGLWTGIVLALTVKKVLVRPLSKTHKLLAADAKAGRVVAVRFEVGSAEWIRFVPEDSTELIDPKLDNAQMLKVRDAEGKWYGVHGLHKDPNGPDHARKQLAVFGPRYAGEPVWMLWPQRWELVLAVVRRWRNPAYPVAVVADTGEMIWGYASLDYTDRYLTDPANLRATAPGLRARPVLPRPYFRPAVHGPMLLRLAVAAAALTPVLLDTVSGGLGALLGLLAATALMDAPFAARRANSRTPDPSRWNVPPVEDFRVPPPDRTRS
ncbi:hypothetical protein [Streptomyces indicus]|uniref:hypothetical protein n=1 Tax=Streptomyces indicus TaxID=417292 RepID=UPI000B82F7EC|nr:hypothetical protein [Streptomyces indicus]